MNHFNYPIGKARCEGRAMRSEALMRRDLLDQMADQAKSVRAATDDLVRAAARVIADRNAGRGFVVTDITNATIALNRVVKELEDMAAQAGHEEHENVSNE